MTESNVKERESSKSIETKKVYANVVLLDNKIINWEIGKYKWNKESVGGITLYNFNFNRINDLEVETSTYLVNDNQSTEQVFDKASEWVNQWEYHETFQLERA